MNIVLATNNPNKVREIKQIFEPQGFSLFCLADLGLAFAAEETGRTFEENSMLKARGTADFLVANGHEGYIVLADDSGLCVDAMDGAPGVDSALYLGEDAPYATRFEQIFENLKDFSGVQRAARFVCVVSCVFPCGKTAVVRGEVAGEIALAPSGGGGFGYDPIFYLPEFGRTMAELSAEEKNGISHRGRAFTKILAELV